MSSRITQNGEQDYFKPVNAPRYAMTKPLADGTAVRWLMGTNHGAQLLEWWRSFDKGATWEKRVELIQNEPNKGASMALGARSDGQQVIVAARCHQQHVYLAFGRFRPLLGNFDWVFAAQKLSTKRWSATYTWPVVALVPLGDTWHVHVFWGRLADGRGRVLYNRARVRDDDTWDIDTESEMHNRVSSVQPRISCAVRHLGDGYTVDESAPDVYVGWSQSTGLGGTADDPEPRTYQARMRGSSSGWTLDTIRVVRESASWSGLIASCFNGVRFFTAQVPYDDDTQIVLHWMSAEDTTRASMNVPALGTGRVIALDVTWDPKTADVYVLAAGATDGLLHSIRYDWAARAWDAAQWQQVDTDVLEPDSLHGLDAAADNRIDAIYTTGAGDQRHANAVVTNVLPSAPSWDADANDDMRMLVENGVINGDLPLDLAWVHNDLDGDPQAQVTIRRSVNGGAYDYFDGLGFSASETNLATSDQTETLPLAVMGTPGDTWQLDIRTADAQGFGPYNAAVEAVVDTPITAFIDTPAQGATITTPTMTVTLQALPPEAGATRFRLYDATQTEVLQDSGWRNTAPLTWDFTDLADGTSYVVHAQVRTEQGLEGTPDTHDITTAFLAPAVPTKLVSWDPVAEAVVLDITNPAGDGSTTADTEYSEVWRQLYDDDGLAMGPLTRVAAGVEPNATWRDHTIPARTPADYTVRAVALTGATTDSA